MNLVKVKKDCEISRAENLKILSETIKPRLGVAIKIMLLSLSIEQCNWEINFGTPLYFIQRRIVKPTKQNQT